jgi:hypothetical protein
MSIPYHLMIGAVGLDVRKEAVEDLITGPSQEIDAADPPLLEMLLRHDV